MNFQNTLEYLLQNLNYYTKYFRENYALIEYLNKANKSFFVKLQSIDNNLRQTENWNQYIANKIASNKLSAKYVSFFDFTDTPNVPSVADASSAIGSKEAGSLRTIKVLSTSEIISLDDTPSSHTELDSVLVTGSDSIEFKELRTWRTLEMNVLDLSGVSGSGTQIFLEGTALENQMYLINIGDDTSIRIRFLLGTTFHHSRCGFYVYEGTGDNSDPSLKYIRSSGGIASIPSWSYDIGYHQLNLFSALLLKYNSGIGYITEGQVYFS